MSPMSLITKIHNVINVITSNRLYLMILAIVLFLTSMFITTNSSNKKQSKRTYIFLYIAAFIFFIIQYGNSFKTLLDYAINEVFITYYFPNIVIYILVLIISNIILWKSIFNDTIDKKIKIINSTAFGFIMYLFILALSLIHSLKLDVFNITELYSSNEVRSILELSMFVFTIWIVILSVYKLIKIYQYKHNIIEVEEFTNYNIINDFDIKRAYKGPTNKFFIEEKQEEIAPKEEPKKEEFSLEEYKIMIKILKEEKARIENPLMELNRLYQSIED